MGVLSFIVLNLQQLFEDIIILVHTGFPVEAETPVTGFISWYIIWLYKYLDDASAMYKSSAAMAAQNSTENPDILDINFYVGLTDTTTYICDFHREQCWDRWL